jgi:hypothetical protein
MIIQPVNVRVNNVPIDQLVEITDPYPTINWDFEFVDRVNVSSTFGVIQDIYQNTRLGYAIKIGRSPNGWGTSGFVGDVETTGFVTGNELSWRYRGPDLLRGQTYYCQLKLTDSDSNRSNWVTFTFAYNALPVATSAIISPTQPSIHDNLLLSYIYSDALGDIESGSEIWWFKNGFHDQQFDNLTVIPSDDLTFGDIWQAQIFPNDGKEFGQAVSTLAITISAQTPTVSNATILPINATYNDPLYAQYVYESPDAKPDNSIIKWYVNATLQPSETSAFARMQLSIGDQVQYQILPSDGEISSGTWVSSSIITILEPSFSAINLRVDAQTETLEATLSPTFTWQVNGPSRPYSQILVAVGTAAGASNIYTTTVNGSDGLFSMPDNILEIGSDYYVTISLGENNIFGNPVSAHFRTTGSLWADVSNSTGWTLETTCLVGAIPVPCPSTGPDGSSSSSTCPSPLYHGIRVSDGTASAEIRLYVNSIQLVAGSTIQFATDNTDYSVITVVAIGSNIKVYKNYQLVLNGTGLFTTATTDKFVEIGAIGTSGLISSSFLGVSYTTAGAYEPSNSQYFDMVFSTFYSTKGNVDWVSGENQDVYYSVSDETDNESSVVYKLDDTIRPTPLTPVSSDQTQLGVNGVATSPSGNFTYFCHDNGVTVFKSRPRDQYISTHDFSSSDTPDDYELFRSGDATTSVSDALYIDTTPGGRLYYSQRERGSVWFDDVTSEEGWTVEFSLSVSNVADAQTSYQTDSDDGVGVYVNDGTHQEVVWFFKDSILLKHANLRIAYDTSSSEYVLCGKDSSLKLYARSSSSEYAELASVQLVSPATCEGNASRPSVTEDALGNQHAVWGDDGQGVRSLYYAFGQVSTDGVNWNNPQQIVNENYNSTNPSIAIDSTGIIYVAFEQSRSDGSDIGMVVKNTFGWSDPFTLTAAPFASKSPRMIVDGQDQLHAVWEDHRNIYGSIAYANRNTMGQWSDISFISISNTDCYRPSIDTDGSNIYFSYTQRNTNGKSDIFVTKFDGTNFSNSTKVSLNGNDADFSDIVYTSGKLYALWHDDVNSNYEIYARQITTNITTVGAVLQLTNDTPASRFPRAGARGGSDGMTGNVYVVFETGGELSPYDPTGFTSSLTTFSGLMYDHSKNHWLASNQSTTIGGTVYGNYNTSFATDDLRQSRRPIISKHFASLAHILYETEMGTVDDEYLSYTDLFTTARDGVWDLTYTNSYSLADVTLDIKVSAQLNRKEVRFGDFCNTHSASLKFSYVRLIAERLEPFEARIILEGVQGNTAVVSNTGDAWIGSANGLSFYSYSQNTLSQFTGSPLNGNVLDITFDGNNIMYVVVNGTVLASHDHAYFYSAFTFVTQATSVAAAKNGILWVSTQNGVYTIKTPKFVVSLPRNGGVFVAVAAIAGTDYTLFTTINGLSSNSCNVVAADQMGQAWVGTSVGLDVVRPNGITSYTPNNSSVPLGGVTDISIVNSAIRYIVTPGGLGRMVGANYDSVTFVNGDWTDNISSAAAYNPNTLWATGGGFLFIIRRDPISGDYSYTSIDAAEFADYAQEEACASYRKYGFAQSISNGLTEVYVNGRLVTNGYALNGNALLFDTSLLPSDKVSVILRTDLQQYVSLEQNKAQQLAYGTVFRELGKFIVNNGRIYGTVNGDQNQIVKYDLSEDSTLPYDRIVLDTTPPVGQLVFVQQLTGTVVQLQIVNYSDNLSGIKNMIVSNYANLTSDGTTPLTWQPFQPNLTFNLGNDFGNIYTQLSFTDTAGTCIAPFNSDVLVGTAAPARIYKYNPTATTWSLSATILPNDPTASVTFLIQYNTTLYAGITTSSGGSLWASPDEVNWTKLINYAGTPYCAAIYNNKMYIGTNSTNGGQLYSFDGINSATIVSQIGTAIYSITCTGTALYLGTGEGGLVYKYVDTTQQITLAVHDNDTRISALGWANVLPANPTVSNPPPDLYLFAGSAFAGRIIKSINAAPFSLSFASTPTEVTQLKQDTNGLINAAVGNNLYKYKQQAWVIVHSDDEKIVDVSFDQDGFFIVSATGIKRINNIKGTKTIYLSLQDVAGNASREPGSDANDAGGDVITTDIDIDDLTDFVLTNKLIELDEYGNILWTYNGDDSFYSGDKVIVEQAQYYSEVFNGGGDLVVWDQIYWDAVVPANTDLTISVRTADTQDALLVAPWAKTFGTSDDQQGDISNLSGQYLQFMVNMSTTVRGLSPKLYRVNIQSRTRTAVHFFTTNFILPTTVVGGILTAQTFIPLAADIIFGINTNDSTDFSDYTIIQQDQLFALTGVQGQNLRIGVKLISPLGLNITTDSIDEYSPYTPSTWVNVIPFMYTNTSGSDQTVQFNVELYDTPAFSDDAASIIYSGSSPTAFAIDGTVTDGTGIDVANGQTVSVFVAMKGNAAIRCNQFYYAQVSVNDGTSTTLLDDTHAFVSNCYVNYVNDVVFDYTNETGSTGLFGYRAKFYSDPTRTQHVKTYSSSVDPTGWTVNGSFITTSGSSIAAGHAVQVEFAPPEGDLPTGDYYLTLDYFDGSNFHNITQSPSITMNLEITYSCGEYSNVPIFKDLAITLQLADYTEQFGSESKTRRTITFNL